MEDIIKQRVDLLQKANASKELQAFEVELCKRDIMHFFNNYTYTDRNTNLYDRKYPDILPFVPYEFQEEFINELRSSIHNGTLSIEDRKDLTNIFVEKSRQMGLSRLVMGVFVY